MTEACIVGWAHTNFGKLDDASYHKPASRVLIDGN